MRTLAERLWSKVNMAGPVMAHMVTPCWVWTGYVDSKGYGKIKVLQRAYLVHRVVSDLIAIQGDGPFILHDCDNPPCMRPDHLRRGTNGDNMRGCVARGRLNPGPGSRTAAALRRCR